ncbi:MAG TPA: diaminobutyrate--2-oxoglutarate transaminase family protein [Polyangia bacterium]|nr:diaminobutyrate--2-oxoglutarate transaminase family protein [Polyangia bacterium]
MKRVNRYAFLERVESNARTYAASFRQVFESGSGVRIRDSRGREFIDCLACAGALPLGHNHPEVQEAVLRFISSGHLQQALDLATPAKFDFVQELFLLLPPQLREVAKIQFCGPSGSDAIEAAIKLTRFATGRQPLIAFRGAYHGMTSGALAAMGNVMPKQGIGLSGNAVHFAPYPDRLHCPFGSDGTQTDELSLGYLRTLLTDPESGIPKPAAIIVEVVQGEGGCIPVSTAWLRGVRDLTAEHDVPLVVDEVQTGLGRTGRIFAFEHAGIVPDVLVLSKAFGGGYPLSVVVYHRRLDRWQRGMHAGTFRGNQIAMVAGRATMSIVRRDRLDQHAGRLGELLSRGLEQIARRSPVIADVRGRGLMLGVEVGAGGRGEQLGPADGELARRIKKAAFDSGLLLETGGRFGAVLRFLPPLIVNETDVGAILDRFEAALAEAMKQFTPPVRPVAHLPSLAEVIAQKRQVGA